MFTTWNQKISVTIDSYRYTLLQCKKGTYNYHINSHFHGEQSFELNYILSGQGTLISSNAYYSISPNTIFLHGPQIIHSQHPDNDGSISEYCIVMEVQPIITKAKVSKADIGSIFYDTNFFYGQDDGTLFQILEQIQYEFNTPSTGREVCLQGLFQQLIVYMVRKYHAESKLSDNQSQMDLNDFRQVIIEKALVNNCSTLTLKELAILIQCSPRQTQRILQKKYGKSFRELKIYYIMSHAANYLTTSQKTIDDISILLGYSTVEQFNRSFKNYYHVTPKQYRLSHSHVKK